MLLTYSDLVKRMKFTYRYNRETLCRKQKLLKGNPTVFWKVNPIATTLQKLQQLQVKRIIQKPKWLH